MSTKNNVMKAVHPSIEKKIDSLLGKMTIEEKIEMIGGDPKKGQSIGVGRLGIPPFRMTDGPMGVHWFTKLSTTYPALILAASTFDTDLIQKMGSAIGRDCIARGIHILLAPGVNIYRSALCGRNFEYCGEDPLLTARVSSAYICGVQAMGVSATVKHFAVNFQEFDRHNVSSDLDERTLREIYLPAFESAVKEAGVGCVMTSYNLVNGIHASEHKGLITDILKKEWGFKGVVMSDWTSVYDAVNPVNAGLDLEMPTAKFMSKENLLPAIKDGRIDAATIDDKIRRILRLGFAFGWMDKDQTDSTIPLADPETFQVSLDVARGGLVLLKNQEKILPLDRKSLKKIAVIGSSSHPAVISGGGSAYNPPSHEVSMSDAIKHAAGPDVEVVQAAGVDLARADKAIEFSEFLSSTGFFGLQMDYFNNDSLSGNAVLGKVVKKVNFGWGETPPEPELTENLYSIRWSGKIIPSENGPIVFYFKNMNCGYKLIIDGKVVVDHWDGSGQSLQGRAVVDLQKNQSHDLKIEYKKIGVWGFFCAGFEQESNIERDRKAALALLKDCDTAIVCVGFDKYNEGEGFDRTFSMSPEVDQFIIDAAKACPKMIVVLTGGGNIDMSRWLDSAKGLLMAWYPGQEGGTAVAETLFGMINPSGKLPVTFEKRLEDRGSFDCYHDDDNDKKVFLKDGIYSGYRHFDKNKVKPLFSFGFGLSYTTFEYEKIKLSSKKINPKKDLEVSFEIVNTGKCAGAEIAQVYVQDMESTIDRPVKELKGFVKVYLKAGERKRVSVKLDKRAFEFWHPEKKTWVLEPGTFQVLVGASCEDIRLKAEMKN